MPENEKVRKINYFDGWSDNVFTLEELKDMEFPGENWLLDPYISRGAISGLVGKPGEGKTMMARMLLCAVAQENSEFLGSQLFTETKRAILVTSEDSELKTREYLLHQGRSLSNNGNDDWISRLTVIMPGLHGFDELIDKLDSICAFEPVDLIVIDSIGSIFPGKDINNTISMRRTLEPLGQLARRRECAVLGIHHLRKSGYNALPDQVHAQGAGGFGQVMRSLLDLRKDPYNPNIRYLSLTKGNYAPDEELQRSRVLQYDPGTHLFYFKGQKIHISQVPVIDDLSKFHDIDWSSVFSDSSEMRRQELIVKLKEEYGLSRATCDRYLRNLKKVGNGLYSLPDTFSLSHSQTTSE
jgi:ABC-type oligopeptide transport system ATPase subunit